MLHPREYLEGPVPHPVGAFPTPPRLSSRQQVFQRIRKFHLTGSHHARRIRVPVYESSGEETLGHLGELLRQPRRKYLRIEAVQVVLLDEL